MRVLRKAINVFEHALNLLWVLAGVVFVFGQLVVIHWVLARTLNLQAPLWGIQVVEYGLLWMTFLGTAWLLRSEGHVRVDVVLNQFNARTQALINTLTSIMGAIIFLVLTWFSAETTWLSWGIMEVKAVAFPKGPAMVVIPVGSFLLFIQFLRRSYRNFKEWRLPPTRG